MSFLKQNVDVFQDSTRLGRVTKNFGQILFAEMNI